MNNNSSENRNKIRDTQPSLKFLAGQLYGQEEYRRYKDHHSFSKFKKLIQKIFKSIRFVIKENISSTDSVHYHQLLCTVERAESRVAQTKNFDEIDQEAITSLLEVLLCICGNMPDRAKSEKFINRQDQWKLNQYRSLMYTQSEAQKRRLLHHVAQDICINSYKIFGSKTDYFCFFKVDCGGDRYRFLDWLSNNHRQAFYEVLKRIGV